MAKVIHETPRTGIHIITFDNGPSGFLDGEMALALESLVQQLVQDPEIRVVILTGAQPDVFIRHFDLAELSQAAEALAAEPVADTAEWDSSVFHRITRLLETLPAVVIAAINGHCMGVGYELALACDIRIAPVDDHCSIGLPEMHIAMMPGGGGTVRLARLLGPSRALQLIATATTVTPQRAQELGMVSQLAEDPLQAAMAMADKIASQSRSAVAAAKRIVYASVDGSIEDALTVEQREVNARLGSEEVRAVLADYVETRRDLRKPLV